MSVLYQQNRLRLSNVREEFQWVRCRAAGVVPHARTVELRLVFPPPRNERHCRASPKPPREPNGPLGLLRELAPYAENLRTVTLAWMPTAQGRAEHAPRERNLSAVGDDSCDDHAMFRELGQIASLRTVVFFNDYSYEWIDSACRHSGKKMVAMCNRPGKYQCRVVELQHGVLVEMDPEEKLHVDSLVAEYREKSSAARHTMVQVPYSVVYATGSRCRAGDL